MEPKQQKFSVAYFVVVLLVIMILQATLFGPHTETITYSDFKKAVAAGKVQDLSIDPQTITGTLILEGLDAVLPKERVSALAQSNQGKTHLFTSTRVEDPQLISELEAAKISFAGKVQNTWLSILMSWV